MTVSAPATKTRGVDPRETRRGDAMHRPPARRSMLKTIGVIVLWQVAALLAVEGILYWAGLGEQDIYKLDREIGFKHFPDKRVTWRSEGYSQSYFDSDGLRDPGLTIAKPAGTYRIALLGDSMVEGLQVPIDQTFGKLIEPKLNAETGRKVQVINFGNSGYSTVQEYLQLKDKVFKYKPDLVVLGYMSRDMFENWTAPDATLTNVRPIALHLPGQNLVVDSSPVQKWMRTPRAKFLRQIEWLRHHSHIWGLVTETEMQLSLQDPLYKGFLSFCTNPGKAMSEWGKNLNEFVKHPPSLAQLAAPSFSIRFFEGNGDTHVAASRKHRKRSAHPAVQTNQEKLALVESSIDKAPSEVPATTSKSVKESMVQSSTNQAPAEVPEAVTQIRPAQNLVQIRPDRNLAVQIRPAQNLVQIRPDRNLAVRIRPDHNLVRIWPDRNLAVQIRPDHNLVRIWPDRNLAVQIRPDHNLVRIWPDRNLAVQIRPDHNLVRIWPDRNLAVQIRPDHNLVRIWPDRNLAVQIRPDHNLVGATPRVARPEQERFVQSSIYKAPATVPKLVGATPYAARQNSLQEAIPQAPSEVFSFDSVFTQELYTSGNLAQPSNSKAPAMAPKMTFVLEPQLNKFDGTPKISMRQADVEISGMQSVSGNLKRGAAKPVTPVSVLGTATAKTANASSGTQTTNSKFSAQPLDVSQAKNGNRIYIDLMSHTMESLLHEMKNECTQHGAKFAVVFIPSRAQLSPTPGMETNFFNITYADEIRLVSKGCVAEHIPFFDGERAAERVGTAQRPDLFYLMHMNAIGHKIFAGQLHPFIAQLIGKTQ